MGNRQWQQKNGGAVLTVEPPLTGNRAESYTEGTAFGELNDFSRMIVWHRIHLDFLFDELGVRVGFEFYGTDPVLIRQHGNNGQYTQKQNSNSDSNYDGHVFDLFLRAWLIF